MDFSQYRKALVYVLTFLAYAWSGYGAGLLSNLKDAVLAAESVFQDLFENAITVARKIKDIHEVFDAAVEENCIFQCPGGTCLTYHSFVILFNSVPNIKILHFTLYTRSLTVNLKRRYQWSNYDTMITRHNILYVLYVCMYNFCIHLGTLYNLITNNLNKLVLRYIHDHILLKGI